MKYTIANNSVGCKIIILLINLKLKELFLGLNTPMVHEFSQLYFLVPNF
jgi:hypothetical protein